MTVPIVPGPFSFLAEAGQAAGDIGQEVKQRKERSQKIAEEGSQFIMQSILSGADPELLDHPDIQKMLKTAYGFSIPSSVARLMGATARRAGAGALAEIDKGVPGKQAAAAATTADVTTAKGQAALDLGLPKLDAETQAAVDQAQKEGAQLNTSIFQGARDLLGKDPQFAKLSYEAATGALDARFRQLEFQRATMSLDRQILMDNARALHDISTELDRSYQTKLKGWQQGLIQAVGTLEGKDRDQAIQDYEDKHPAPDRETEYTKDIRGYGMTLDEFQKRYRDAMGRLFTGKKDTTTTRTATGTSGVASTAPDLGKVVERARGLKPDEAAAQLLRAVQEHDLTDIQAKVIVRSLRKQAPGDWFKAFNRIFTKGSVDIQVEPDTTE